MPETPPHPCRQPKCPNLVERGKTWCEIHGKRKSAAKRGYDGAWRNVRANFLAHNPYCVHCGAPGNEVDHIVPHRGNRALFENTNNLQTLCKSCHSRKTIAGG